MAASSESQSQPGPVRYSYPRPAGGASVRIVSTSSSLRPTALSTGWTRTRCCVVTVPAASA